MAAGDLCVLEDVLAHLQKRDDDSNGAIDTLITTVSTAITKFAGRQFVAEEGDVFSEKRFLDNGSGIVLLTPFDAREIETVSTQIQGQDSTELDETAWTAEPYHLPDGVFHTIRLESDGRRAIVVSAKWGFPEIPEDIRGIAIATVAFTYRRDVAAFSSQYNDGIEQSTTYELPPFARAALARYRTPTV